MSLRRFALAFIAISAILAGGLVQGATAKSHNDGAQGNGATNGGAAKAQGNGGSPKGQNNGAAAGTQNSGSAAVTSNTVAAAVAQNSAPNNGAQAKGHKNECNGTFSHRTFHGGLVVKAGDNCSLSNVVIDGGMRVTGGTFDLQNSKVNGGLRITGGTAPNDQCGDNINGGLRVIGTNEGGSYDFGEANAEPFCPGGKINGGVRFVNNNALFLEIDGYVVHGRVVDTGNTLASGGLNEIESTHVHGSALCANNSPAVINDIDVGDAPGPNSYTGNNKGCPS